MKTLLYFVLGVVGFSTVILGLPWLAVTYQEVFTWFIAGLTLLACGCFGVHIGNDLEKK